MEPLESRTLLSATVSALPVHAVEGQLASFTVATFTASNKAARASNFVATISWGDGSTSGGTVKKTSSGFSVSAKHFYAEEISGFDIVSVAVTDKTDGTVNQFSNSVQVVDAPIKVAAKTLKVHAGVAFTVVAGTGTDFDKDTGAGDIAAKIDWGDGSALTDAVPTLKGKKWLLTGSHTYATKGTHTATINMLDIFGGSTSSARFKVIVS